MDKVNLKYAYVISTNSETRKKNDYYPTAPLATMCLLREYGKYIKSPVWEPAAGRGWISEVLQDNGYQVTSTDLYEYDSFVPVEFGIDYLEATSDCRSIITNPPYKNGLAQKFIEKSIQESDFSAFFLRLTFMESLSRHKLFTKHPPSVLVFSRRMNCQEEKFGTFDGQIGGMVAYAWYVWGKDVPSGTIQWIDPKEIVDEQIPSLF